MYERIFSARVLILVNTESIFVLFFLLLLICLALLFVCRLLFMLLSLLFEISSFCSISKGPLCCRIASDRKKIIIFLISVVELN